MMSTVNVSTLETYAELNIAGVDPGKTTASLDQALPICTAAQGKRATAMWRVGPDGS